MSVSHRFKRMSQRRRRMSVAFVLACWILFGVCAVISNGHANAILGFLMVAAFVGGPVAFVVLNLTGSLVRPAMHGDERDRGLALRAHWLAWYMTMLIVFVILLGIFVVVGLDETGRSVTLRPTYMLLGAIQVLLAIQQLPTAMRTWIEPDQLPD